MSDGKTEQPLRSEESLGQGNFVEVEGEMAAGGILGSRVTILEGEQAKKALETIRTNITSGMRLPDAPFFDDEISRRLWPELRNVAAELVIAKKLGRSVLLRFHGDADGICSAFAISGVVLCKAYQQNSAVYSVKDALRDIAAIGQESMPLILLVDFGSAEGCREGLELLTAAGIEYMIIDHHPFKDKNPKMVNPLSFAANASKYTAGYLACEIAVACGMERERGVELAAISCSGDKSDLVKNGEAEAKKAMVLDFLASHVSFGNNLEFYKKVMGNSELFGSIAVQADESIEEAAAKAMQRAKKTQIKGVEVVTFSLENIVKKGEWPPSSKVTTRVFDKLKGKVPILCIGHTDRSIIMRLSDEAAERGLSANDLAESVKKAMADFVDGGGGHVRAGAIRAKVGFVKEVLGQLLREIEEKT